MVRVPQEGDVLDLDRLTSLPASTRSSQVVSAR